MTQSIGLAYTSPSLVSQQITWHRVPSSNTQKVILNALGSDGNTTSCGHIHIGPDFTPFMTSPDGVAIHSFRPTMYCKNFQPNFPEQN